MLKKLLNVIIIFIFWISICFASTNTNTIAKSKITALLDNQEKLYEKNFWLAVNSWSVSTWNIKVQFVKTKNNLKDYFQVSKWTKKRNILLPYIKINQKYKSEIEPVHKEKFLTFVSIDQKWQYINFVDTNYEWVTQYILNINNWKVISKFVNRGACKEVQNYNNKINLICLWTIAPDTYKNKNINFINTWYENIVFIENDWFIYIKSYINPQTTETKIFVYDKKTLKQIDSF